MTFDAGLARGRYELDTSGFDASAKRVLDVYKQIEAAQQRASRAAPAAAGAATARVPSSGAGATNTRDQDRDLQRLRDSEILAARATGNHAQALSLIEGEMQRAGEGTVRYNRLIATQARVQDQAAAGVRNYAQQIGREVVGSLTAMVGPAAIAAGALGTLNKAVEAGGAALSLRETQNTLKALSGSTTEYNRVVDTARQQQLLFGGSLEENIRGLQGLVVTSRSTGASLNTLINLGQRLAILDPAQGAEGARVALSEVLSGDPRSLARRYEIPLSALEKIKDESIPVADRLKVLDDYLTKIGITSDVVGQRVDASATAYRRLGAAADVAKTTIGGFLADAFAPAANIGADLLGAGGFGGFAVAAQNVQQALLGLPPISKETAAANQGMADSFLRGGQEVLRFLGITQQAAPAMVQAADAADRLAASTFQAGSGALRAADADDRLAASKATVTNTIAGTIAAMNEAAQKSLADSAAMEAQSAQADLLNEKNRLVVDAFLTLNPQIDASAAASLAAAQGYSPQIQQLIALGVEARNARAALAELNGAGSVPEGRAERDRPADRAAAAAAGAEAGRQRAAAAEEARRDQIRKTGTLQQKIALDQLELQEAIAKSGKGSADAIRAQTQLIADQQGQLKRAGGGGGGGGLAADRNLAGAGLQGAERLEARLAEVNRQLDTAKLSEVQRKNLTAEKLDLETKIGDELDKQRRASIDAQLGAVKDAEARLKEERELAGLRAQQQSGRFSDAQQQAARLREQEILLEQQKRGLDIQRDAKAAGLAAPAAQQAPPSPAPQVAAPQAITQPLPIPNLAALPNLPPPSAVNLSLTIELDPTTGQATVVNPQPGVNVLDVLIKSAVKG